jgi:hypothetical protein
MTDRQCDVIVGRNSRSKRGCECRCVTGTRIKSRTRNCSIRSIARCRPPVHTAVYHDSFVRAPRRATRHRIGEISTRYAKRSSTLSLPYGFRDRDSPRESLTRLLPQPSRPEMICTNTKRVRPTKTNLLRRWEAELILAGRRLQVIDKNISHLESFQIAYLSVFPEALRLSPRDTHA